MPTSQWTPKPRMHSELGRRRPNLLILFPDQFRSQAQGHRGQDPVHTPQIDRLAREGTDCVRAYSNSPVCSPARAMWHTGRYPFSNGVVSNCHSGHADYGIYLKQSERCLSDVLTGMGYDVGYIGKWHLDAPTEPYVSAPEPWDQNVWDAFTPAGPQRHGHSFWYAYGCSNDHMHPHYWRTEAQHRIQVDGWSPRHETDVAIEYIRNRNGDQRDSSSPFALTLSWNPPHPPHHQVPAEYLEHYRTCSPRDLLRNPNVDHDGSPGEVARAASEVRGYFGAITGIDDQVGRLLDCLREEGLEDDTLVVFASDHGEMMGSHGRIQKSVWFEESMGIPFLVRMPGRVPAGARCDALLGMPDVMPTILGLLGFRDEIPASVEGRDLSGVIMGETFESPEALLYMNVVPELVAMMAWAAAGAPESPHYHAAELKALVDDPENSAHLTALLAGNPLGARGVRTPSHTYVIRRTAGEPDEHLLYSRTEDPSELRNCISSEPDVAAHHHRLLNELLMTTQDPWSLRDFDHRPVPFNSNARHRSGFASAASP